MTIEERARALVGDMPWVTEHMSPDRVDDLRKQIQTSMEVGATEFAYGVVGNLFTRGELARMTVPTCDAIESVACMLKANRSDG